MLKLWEKKKDTSELILGFKVLFKEYKRKRKMKEIKDEGRETSEGRDIDPKIFTRKEELYRPSRIRQNRTKSVVF